MRWTRLVSVFTSALRARTSTQVDARVLQCQRVLPDQPGTTRSVYGDRHGTIEARTRVQDRFVGFLGLVWYPARSAARRTDRGTALQNTSGENEDALQGAVARSSPGPFRASGTRLPYA